MRKSVVITKTFDNWRICLLLLALAGMRSSIAEADKALSQEIRQAIGAEGTDYLDRRNRLVAEYKEKSEEFKAIKAKESDWRIGLLVSIVEERATKESLVKSKILNVKAGGKPSRVDGERIASIVQSLTNNAQATPMVLVEKIWKDNEYTNMAGPGVIQYSGVVMTVGRLEAPYAREVLEAVVTNRNYFAMRPEFASCREENGVFAERLRWTLQMVRGYAAKALGLIGDERSVPALLTMWEETADDSSDVMSTFAYESLTKCATKKSIDILNKSLRENRSANFKTTIQMIIDNLSKKQTDS